MGTFEKTVVVDGQEYEVYSHSEDGTTGYQLVTKQGEVIVAELTELPDDDEVAGLVRAADGSEAEAA